MANSKRKCGCGCKQWERRENMLITPSGAFLNEAHQYQHALDALGRLRKRKAKEERQKHKLRKREFIKNDLPRQKALTQTVFNKMIRLLDKDQPCISCNRPATWQGQWHASHVLSVGSMPALRYNACNCYKACSICNKWLSGNIAEAKKGVIARYGLRMINFLEGPHAPAHFECEDLIELRALFSAECRRLEDGKKPTWDWRALE